MTSKEKIEKAWELVNDKHVETNDEIQLVRYAVRTARELVERDTPKKVEIGTSKNYKFPICPNCKVELNGVYRNKYCKKCGQRLDWRE
jgi:tRNA(Ile2) C34 agmatinyltransferase TiaS